jgi:hypothetical protein
LVTMRRGQGTFVRHFSVASVVAALSLAASASPATASVTVGQTAQSPPVSSSTGNSFDLLQATVASGNSYVVPATGTLTSWSTYANAGGGMLAMKIYRPLGGSTYMAVAHDGPRPLIPSMLNTFTGLSVQVKAGDVLGDGTPSAAGGPSAIFLGAPGDQNLFRTTLADGAQGAFADDDPDYRVNASAVINPANSFTPGAVTRNKKKGTATLAFNLPNPGDFSGSGQGAQVASTAAVTSKAVPAGIATLVVKAKGKKKRKLNETGKVKLNLAVTYTPTGGDPSTQSVKVKLKKRL